MKLRTPLAAAFLFAAMTFSQAALARPGTPNEVTAYVEDHRRIGFSFRNTASEPVVFDFDVQVNGVASNIQYLNCGAPYETDTSCKKATQRQQPFTYKGQLISVSINHILPSARVCLRVIAREWNNGDFSSGQVSDQWSAWSCGTMKALPAPPATPPAPQLQYFAPVPARGLPGDVRLSGSYPPPRFASTRGRLDVWSTTEKLVNGQWAPVELKPVAGTSWPLDDAGVAPPSSLKVMPYRVCVTNDGGTRCSAPASVYQGVTTIVTPPPPQGGGIGNTAGPPCTTCGPSGSKPKPPHLQ